MSNIHVTQLSKSQRGRHCLKGLEIFLANHCHSLDLESQYAMVCLIREYTDAPDTTIEEIQEGITKQ
jgi:hypothetical protein